MLVLFDFLTEIECLAEHGITLPPNMQGLTEEQIVDLKLKDDWADRCTPQGGVRENPDKVGVRNGQGWLMLYTGVVLSVY